MLWRSSVESNSLWCAIIKSKYGLQDNGWEFQMGNKVLASCSWKFISQGLLRFLESTSLVVGGGGGKILDFGRCLAVGEAFSTLFPWLDSLLLTHNISISSIVSSFSFPHTWDFKFFSQFK